MADDEVTFRQSLLSTLSGTFSIVKEERLSCEEQLKIFETSEGFGVHLTNIIIDGGVPGAIRQLASVVLKQYIEGHWSHLATEKFKPPETSEQAKAIIRETLPKALQDPSNKIRSCVAYALSSIAHWDWPEHWPGFFNLLIQALNSGDQNLIHGAIRVMTEFVKEVPDLQMPHVAPIILPNLLNIVQHPENYSLRTVGRSIDIFNTVADMIGLMTEVYKGAAKELFYPLLPNFVESFTKSLTTPNGVLSDYGLKMEVLKALQTLVRKFPRFMSNYLPVILPPVWQIFTESVEYFVQSVVNTVAPHEDAVDEDGEVLSFENLIFSIFEFITALVDTPRFKKTIKEYLESIMFYTMLYMQITDEQKDVWMVDLNKFVEDEDEESLSDSVRISAQYLLMSLCEKYQKSCAQSFVNSVVKIMQRGDLAKSQNDINWWKYHEVCLLSLGFVQPTISDMMQKNQLKFDADTVLFGLMMHSCQLTDLPFLMGQALWCSSRYVSALSSGHVESFVGASVAAVQENNHPVTRMYAVKAIFGFCDQLKETDKVNIIKNHLQPITSGLLSMSTHNTDSALALTLETLHIVLTIDKDFTVNISTSGNVIPLTNALFLKYGSDVHLSSILGEIFGVLASNPGCSQVLLEKTVPMVTSVIESSIDKVPQAIISPCLDVVTEIIRNSSKPLPDALITRSFPAVVQCILRSEDYSVIQDGGECIRAYVSGAVDQLMVWRDSNGHSGIDYVVQVINFLLDPRLSENSAVFVGKLINSLVIKAGAALGDNLQGLLKAVLSKLQQAVALNVIQSLLMVFIQMIRYQLEMTFEFLSLVPGPTGGAALDYILTEWCNKQNSFYGAYERKASCDALCKVLQHALSKGDQRFQQILVAGDEINSTKGIQTRSKSVKEYSQIPVGIKIFKLIVNEFANEVEKQEFADDENEDEEEEEDDEEWEDVEDESGSLSPKDLTVQGIIEAMFAPSSDYPGFDFGDDVEDADDDPDVKDDAINETNMKLYLRNFIEELSKQSYFMDFANYLNDSERQCLLKAGIVST